MKKRRKKTKQAQPFSSKEQVFHLKRLNRKDKLAIFLGAGVSASCGLPDWFLLLNTLKIVIENNGIELGNDVDIANVARSFFGDKFNSVVADCLYAHGLNISDSVIAVSRSGVKCIVCFNFDDILEEAYSAECIDHRVVLNGERFNLNTDHTTIFHPHGFLGRFDSAEEQKNSSIVLSRSDYEALYQDHYCLTNLIQLSMLMTRTVLFVGMSMTDPNILRLLTEARKIGVRNWHYALLKAQDGEQVVVDTQRLRNVGVDPIWYQNYSDVPEILNEISKEATNTL